MRENQHRQRPIRRCFAALLLAGIGLLGMGIYVVPTVMPYAQLDFLLTQAQLRDDKLRDETLAMLQKSCGVAHGRMIAMLFAAPCGLLFVTALSAVWSARVRGNDRKTIMAICGTMLATPLVVLLGTELAGSPIFGLVFAALALGAFVMEGGLGDKHEEPAADPSTPDASSP